MSGHSTGSDSSVDTSASEDSGATQTENANRAVGKQCQAMKNSLCKGYRARGWKKFDGTVRKIKSVNIVMEASSLTNTLIRRHELTVLMMH